MSGRTGKVLYTLTSPENQTNAQFGFFISVPGDLNGDGADDVVVGTDAQDVGPNVDQGKAWAFSGANGSLLYALDNPAPQASARFGSRIGRAGDVTGDGIPDVIVGASNNDVPANCGNTGGGPTCRVNQGQAFIFNGRTGALVRTLDLPVADQTPTPCTPGPGVFCGNLGLAVQGPGDVNGDGITDQLVDASTANGGVGRMYVFDGATGAVIRTIDSPEPQVGDNFGFQDAAPLAPGDVNGDGVPDLYANGFLHDGPAGPGEGAAWVFSGTNGSLLYKLRDPTPTAGGQFGWSLARTDLNKDGRPDLYIGQSPHHVAGEDENGGTYVFDGPSRSLLAPLEIPASDRQGGAAGPRLGWTVSAPGDLNHDGYPDFLGGAPFSDVGANTDQGVLYVFLSKPKDRCKGKSATLVGSNGADDLVGTNGRDIIVGLNGKDTIRGRGGKDLICAGRGKDLVKGKGGKDKLYGGKGKDLLKGGPKRDRLFGNAGKDRLFGGKGNDILRGGKGKDVLRGGKGRDSVKQ